MVALFAGSQPETQRRRAAPLTVSLTVHLVVLLAVVLPGLVLIGELPELPTMMAFVAEMPSAPPPPPPPPPPSSPAAAAARDHAAPSAAPVEAPATIAPESGFEIADAGVIGGVEGGIPGGVPGGIEIGGMVAPPPPPPPPPPAQRAPVRIGGGIAQPALLVRVPPVYPEIAARAQVQGMVILEAIVDEEGTVGDIRVLRSVKFLDEPAIEAVRQWRYSPLLLNGEAVPFVLTVTVSFKVDTAGR